MKRKKLSVILFAIVPVCLFAQIPELSVGKKIDSVVVEEIEPNPAADISLVTRVEGNSKKNKFGLTMEGRFNALRPSETIPALRIRLFAKKNLAIRGMLSYTRDRELKDIYENPDGTGGRGEQEKISQMFSGAIGLEGHFTGTEKLSPYIGSELGFGFGSNQDLLSNTDSVNFIAGNSVKKKAPISSISLSAVAGFDYYIFKNVYVGYELGFGFSRITKAEETVTTTVGTNTPIETFTPGNVNDTYGIINYNQVRIGWKF